MRQPRRETANEWSIADQCRRNLGETIAVTNVERNGRITVRKQFGLVHETQPRLPPTSEQRRPENKTSTNHLVAQQERIGRRETTERLPAKPFDEEMIVCLTRFF
jgi:hypothetical protein